MNFEDVDSCDSSLTLENLGTGLNSSFRSNHNKKQSILFNYGLNENRIDDLGSMPDQGAAKRDCFQLGTDIARERDFTFHFQLASFFFFFGYVFF